MIAEQWHTTLSPPVRLRESRDVGHGGMVAPIAVSNGGQSGRMRFSTHTPAFLLSNLLYDSMPHRLPRRVLKEAAPGEVALARFLSYRRRARISFHSRPFRRLAPALAGHSATFHPGASAHPGTCSGHSNRRAAARAVLSHPSGRGGQTQFARRAFFPKMNFAWHPAGEAFVYINV